jgi:hypothetical protein
VRIIDNTDFLAIMFGAVLLFIFFLFNGGGRLLDKWIDGSRKRWFNLVDEMPEWLLKILRILLPTIYAVFVIYVVFIK